MNMASMTEVKCTCGKLFEARTADVKRGWGKFCSKSCKAIKQTKDTGIAGPDYKAADRSVHQMKSGSYVKSQFSGKMRGGPRGVITNVHYDEWDEEVIEGDVVWSAKHRAYITLEDHNGSLDDDHPFDSDAAGFNNT